MTQARSYSSPEAFKQALEIRLRAAPNLQRVRDLPDIALLATMGRYEAANLRRAFEATFAFRGTHVLPSVIPEPPDSWAVPYARMARENQLAWHNIDNVMAAVRAFLEPVLAGTAGVWDPDAWRWAEGRNDSDGSNHQS